MSSTSAPRAIRSTSPRFSRRAAPPCRRPCGTPSWRAWRIWARAAGSRFEVIASAPPVAESWLLEAVAGDCAETVAAGLAAGMLVAVGEGIGFRHEIAREAVERWIAPRTAPGAASHDPRRARRGSRAGSGAPRPPRGERRGRRRGRALRAGGRRARGRRRRAPPGGRAVRPGAALRGRPPGGERAALHELRAEALYAADDQVASIADLYEAIALHRELGDVGAEADATRRLVPRLTCRGLMDEAREAATTAVALLAATPERRENAGALAALAHLHVYEDDLDAAITVGRRAVAIATAFGDTEVSVDAAITAGIAEGLRDGPGGRTLEEALATAPCGGGRGTGAQGAERPRLRGRRAPRARARPSAGWTRPWATWRGTTSTSGGSRASRSACGAS